MKLHRAAKQDLTKIQAIQQAAFAELYEKYQDHQTSPALVSIDRLVEKWQRPEIQFFLFKEGQQVLGSVCLKVANGEARISNLAILPAEQGQGYGQQFLQELEKAFPEITSWELATIKEEQRLVHFYEKSGYHLTGDEYKIQAGMTGVSFRKICENHRSR